MPGPTVRFSLRDAVRCGLVGFATLLVVPMLLGALLSLIGAAVSAQPEPGDPPVSADDARVGSGAATALPDDEAAAASGPAVGAATAEEGHQAVEPAGSDAEADGAPVEEAGVATDPPPEEAAEDEEAPTASAALELTATDTPLTERLISFFGLFGLIGIAWLMSTNRRAVNWRLVTWGCALQLGFALFILKTPIGGPVFDAASAAFVKILSFTDVGNQFLFGSYVLDNEIHPGLINFVFAVLPTIIFFSSLMTVLYHLGVMQKVVEGVAWFMRRTMGTSGSETLSASANIFVGQTEAPLMVKPFVNGMTSSELMAIMVGGFATVAGGVLALYVQFLRPHFPDIAGHLMAASVMSAPAALVIAKVMYPETEESETMGEVKVPVDRPDANAIDAAARGAGEGLQLALNVAAMLLAFIALIALVDYVLGVPSFVQHRLALSELLDQIGAAGGALPEELMARCGSLSDVAAESRAGCISDLAAAAGVEAPSAWPVLKLETIFGWFFFPIAWLMGAPPQDCFELGKLLGQKMVVNELYAYVNLAEMLTDPETSLSPRTVVIATYALCGFANFGSIAIQIGGIGGIAPKRRHDLAKLGLRAMIGGTIAAFMTATIAGIIV